ncbi:fibroin heavy chain-like [Vombatus ursinus]|uniref:fibroin heavy chain-like n=1 Tax=Vombatus ursinus TaxID=29139 RepID=UPI000FFD6AB1|nr:fibroin heavy chain-like [Vombatus ursinus]
MPLSTSCQHHGLLGLPHLDAPALSDPGKPARRLGPSGERHPGVVLFLSPYERGSPRSRSRSWSCGWEPTRKGRLWYTAKWLWSRVLGGGGEEGYRNGLRAGAFPRAGAQTGLGAGMKPQKAAYRNGLGNGAFPGAGAQSGLGAGTKPQKPGYGNGLGNGVFPGVGAQSGYRNGLGAGGFPGAEAQPGFGAGTKPQKAGFGTGMGIQRAGNGNGLQAGAFPGARAQPGPCNGGSIPAPNGVGPATGSPSEKGGVRAQNGYGAGLEDGLKTQKTGLRNGFGAGAFPGAGIQPGYGAMNGYGAGLRGAKPQKTGYGNGLGAGAFPESGPQPGFGTPNGFGVGLGGVKPQKAVYSNGLGAGTFPEVRAQQAGFPGAESYPANNYSNGGASSFGPQGVPFLPEGSDSGAKTAKNDYGNGVGVGSYPADGSPPGGPDVKHSFNSFLGNGYGGHCPPGKC